MDFNDDGGTPMWRARQQQLIVVAHPSLKARLGQVTLVQWLILIGFFAYVLPFVLVFGVPAIGALLNWIMG